MNAYQQPSGAQMMNHDEDGDDYDSEGDHEMT